MKILRVTTRLEITEHELGDSVIGRHMRRKTLCDLIGKECSGYERVYPRRLYKDFNHKSNADGCDAWPGVSLVMLVDESGALRGQDLNLVGSWLYGSDGSGNAIMGNILFVSEDAGDYCGIEPGTLRRLKEQLGDLVMSLKAASEEWLKTELKGK